MRTNLIEIILAEDNPSDAQLTILALKCANITNTVVHLKDGAETLDYIFSTGNYAGKTLPEMPRIILLDMKMPKLNGLDVLRKLKKEKSTQHIPVVVFTSSHEDSDVKECYALGVNSYVVKPLDFGQFSKVVEKIGLYWTLVNQVPN